MAESTTRSASDTDASGRWQGMGSRIRRRFRTIQVVSNLVGVTTCVTYFVYFDDIRPVLVGAAQYLFAGVVVTAVLFLFGFFINYYLQTPVMQYVALRADGYTPSAQATRTVQRRLLNIPLIAGAVGLANWSLAAVIIPLLLIHLSPPAAPGERCLHFLWVFTGIILSGGVTSVMAYFGQEISVRRLHQDFFPHGGVTKMKGVFRVNLRTRVLLFFFMGGLFPMMDMAFLAYNKARLVLSHDPQVVLDELRALLIFTLLVVGALTITLAHFLTRSIVDPIERLRRAMNRVAAGDLAARAKVHDNNELGQLGDHFNRMTAGLRERYELRRTLALAREVQQTLLPQQNPTVPGLEIAGKSIYCDETGGDYWDYLLPEGGAGPNAIAGGESAGSAPGGTVGLAVGDVSGHGLPAALLMASVRAALRQRVALGGDLATVIADVNRQFSRDAETSGNFMTLFYLAVDRPAGRLEWVRAGHDPALLYDPHEDRFEELRGAGMALGVDDGEEYRAHSREGLREGQVILLGTDGIWEARTPEGVMLGKAPVKRIMRERAHASAAELVAALAEWVQDAVKPGRLEDDLTIVVVKIVAPDSMA